MKMFVRCMSHGCWKPIDFWKMRNSLRASLQHKGNGTHTVPPKGDRKHRRKMVLRLLLALAGFKGVWLAAQTLGGASTSAWQALGAEVTPGQ